MAGAGGARHGEQAGKMWNDGAMAGAGGARHEEQELHELRVTGSFSSSRSF